MQMSDLQHILMQNNIMMLTTGEVQIMIQKRKKGVGLHGWDKV